MKTIRARLRPDQLEAYQQFKRFNVMLAHRRFGKTYLGILWLIKEIWEETRNNPRGYYYAPNYAQAKKVAWQYIKNFTQAFDGVTYNESELRVNWGERQIQLGSAENPDSSRGIYADAVILDEPAQMAPRMWTEVLRPALSDRDGHALMIGTPKGRHGLFYESFENALDDPLWQRFMYKVSDTGIIDDDELQAIRRSMSRAEYLQEFECSFDAAIRGAYWGETMAKLENDGHITRIEHDVGDLVYVGFDLGVNDATACWFFQLDGNRYNFIDYEEYTNIGLPQIDQELRAKGYTYGKMIIPHDGKVRSLSTGKKRSQTMRDLGWDVVFAPRPNSPSEMTDHIEVTRQGLTRAHFDKDKCSYGVEALRQFRAEWDDKHAVARLSPVHDWASHGSASMRYIMNTALNTVAGTWGTEIDYSRMDQGIASAN